MNLCCEPFTYIGMLALDIWVILDGISCKNDELFPWNAWLSVKENVVKSAPFLYLLNFYIYASVCVLCMYLD